MELRPYQVEARDAVLSEWQAGHKKTMLVLPTGCGKTVVFSDIIRKRVQGTSHRALVLAHREELLAQAADKLEKMTGIVAALEKGSCSSLGSCAAITVGSVQSMMQEKRLNTFPANYFDVIVVDEAHHALSESYQKVLNHFNTADVLGVTATPDRADKKSLAAYFDSEAYSYTMMQAVREGYLSPIVAQMRPVEIDLTKVNVSHGEYQASDLGVALDPFLEKIAADMASEIRDRKTVVFLPLVATSQKFCAMLRSHGLTAAEVNGMSDDREQVLSDFDAGKYQVLCNSMLLTEGWDCPSVDCIAVLRPTRSRSLYQQMVGRGMRLSPGKKYLLLLDYLWLTDKYSLCRPAHLVSKSKAIAHKITEKIFKEGARDILDAEQEAAKDVQEERERALARELQEQRRKKARLVDPLQYSMSINDEDLASYEPSFEWEKKPVSEKQAQLLERRGINPESVDCAGRAKLIIDRLFARQREGLATPKQIRQLERYGFKRVGEWSFDEATKIISILAVNNWRLPRHIRPDTYVPDNMRVA